MKTNDSVLKNPVLLRSEVNYFYYSYNAEHNYDASKPPGGFGRGRVRGWECPNLAGAGNWPFWKLAGAVNFINPLSKFF